MSMEQVVVSAGEPVAWLGEEIGERWATAFKDVAADLAQHNEGVTITGLFRAAPVVLPEEPPADLIEQMARAALEEGGDYTWERSSAAGRELYAEEARASYAAFRAWVAAGGETR